MDTRITTAGYQGETIDQFVSKLIEAEVDVLVDVRALPLSRKKGFSKTALCAALSQCGIDYLHVKDLGMPKDLRDQRHQLRDNAPILDAYDEILPSKDQSITQMLSVIAGRKACLMCFEADPDQCHRSRLFKYLVGRYPTLMTSGVGMVV